MSPTTSALRILERSSRQPAGVAKNRSDPVDVVRRAGGLCGRAVVLRQSSRRQLDRALADQRLVTLGRSTVALPQLRRDQDLARAAGGVLAGESAALHHGWPVKQAPPRPVVIVARNASHPRPDLEVHRRDLAPGSQRDGVLTTVATVIDCARSLPFDRALTVADAALRTGRVTREQLETAAACEPSRFRPRVVRVIRCADGRSANPFESVARAVALGIPGLNLIPQYWIDDARPDLADPLLKVVVECDSYEFHADPEPFRRDVRRYTRLTVDGWLVVRLVWEDVMKRPDEVEAVLQRATALALARLDVPGTTR